MKKRITVLVSLLTCIVLVMCLVQPAFADGMTPIAENLEIKTYRNVSVGGNLKAFDPDGDGVSFEISTAPVKGTIDLREDGSFIYTPWENKRGKDYFGYRAIDSDGNRSQEATVIVTIQKQKKDVSYSDIEGSDIEYAAVALSEYGIFTGEQIGGHYCFCPDRELTRGEFLSMCMLLSDEPGFAAVMNTGFADDGEIPTWMKPYVAAASMCNISCDHIYGEERRFDPDYPVSRTEAAVMLDGALNLTNVSYLQLDACMSSGEAQSIANLVACGVMEGGAMANTLTRAQAAELIVNAVDLKASKAD